MEGRDTEALTIIKIGYNDGLVYSCGIGRGKGDKVLEFCTIFFFKTKLVRFTDRIYV